MEINLTNSINFLIFITIKNVVMIISNITSFEGQCSDAEHFYCSYDIVDNDTKIRICCDEGEHNLRRRILDQEAVDHLNEKDSWSGWHIGMRTQKFQSIDQIHEKLKEIFPDQNIIT